MADGASPSSPPAPARPGGWASTRSSWARAATARCCASSRSPSRTDDGSVRVEVLDPLDERPRPGPAGRGARRPRRRDRPARRAPGRRAAAPRAGAPSPQRLRHAGRRRLRRDARPARLRGAAAASSLGVRLRKSASFTRWDQRPLSRGAGRLRPRGRPAPARSSPTRCRTARRARAGWSGRARSAARSRTPPTSATSTRVFGRLPRVNSLDPAQRAVARELVAVARGDRRERGPARVQRSCRTPAGRDRQAPAAATERLRQIRGLHEGTLRRRGKDDPRGGRARPRARADPRRGRAPAAARLRRRAADRPRRGARARPRRRGRAGLRAARRARRPAADRHGGARRARAEPDVRTLQGWRREVVGAELLELLAGRRSLRVGTGRRLEVTPLP